MDNLSVGAPVPSSIGACADLYHDIRTLRLSMDSKVREVKARETEIREHIIDTLSKAEDTGAAGQRYRAQIVTKVKYNVLDWGIVTAWIRKNDRFDMLQKRLSDVAVKDWVEANERILPGTERLTVPDVSITKI